MSTAVQEQALEVVTPRYRYVPDTAVGNFGDEIVDMMGLMGRQLDPTQARDVADLSSYDRRGRWVSLESGVKEARQNGKTSGVVLPVALFDLFHLPPDRVCWTAHRFKTARATFDDVLQLLDVAPEYARRVRKISNSHGDEGIYLKSGASLEFLARENGGSGRGLGGKRNVFDEALILKGALIGSLMPTLSARRMAHINYASSAALLTEDSDHLRTLTKRGRYATMPDRFIWIEYCAPGGWGTNPCDLGDECPHDGRLGCRYPLCQLGTDCPHTLNAPGCALDNPEFIRAANHAAGDRISWQYLADERVGMADIPREYGRERLGWDEEPPAVGTESGVDMARFNALANTRLLPPGAYDDMAVVVDMPPDRSEANICVAWVATDPKTQETRPAVMLHTIARDAGDAEAEGLTARVLRFLAGLPDDERTGTDPAEEGLLEQANLLELAIQTGGPAGSLIKPLNARGRDAWPEWQVKPLTAQECAQAVGYWLDSVKDGSFWHLGQDKLRDAQRDGVLRNYGDALMWSRDDLSNISGLIAATLALHRLFTEGDQGGPNVW